MDIPYQKIVEGGKVAVAEAIAHYRKLGEAIAIWPDGKVVVLNADQIPAQLEDSSPKSFQALFFLFLSPFMNHSG